MGKTQLISSQFCCFSDPSVCSSIITVPFLPVCYYILFFSLFLSFLLFLSLFLLAFYLGSWRATYLVRTFLSAYSLFHCAISPSLILKASLGWKEPATWVGFQSLGWRSAQYEGHHPGSLSLWGCLLIALPVQTPLCGPSSSTELLLGAGSTWGAEHLESCISPMGLSSTPTLLVLVSVGPTPSLLASCKLCL